MIDNVKTKETALNLSFRVDDITIADKPNINVIGYIDTYSGYGNHCRNVLDGLNGTGNYNVKLTALKSISDVDPAITGRYKNNLYMDKFNYEDSISLSITAPGYMQKDLIPKCKKSFSWTMTETNQIPKHIAQLCKNVDTIICPTITDKDKFEKAGIKNSVVCNLGYDDKLYNKETPKLDISNLRGRYVFGAVGSWNARKSPKAIVKAFCKAFKSSDKVSLLFVSKYATVEYEDRVLAWDIRAELDSYINEAVDEFGLDYNKLPHITLTDKTIHESVMPLLMSRIDCLVGLSCGESTWLPGLEMAAIGRPIIQLANPFAGYMEYLYDSRYLCSEVSNEKVGIEFTKGISDYYKDSYMAFGNYNELSEKMIMVYKDIDSVAQMDTIDKVRCKVLNRTWKDSLLKLRNILF